MPADPAVATAVTCKPDTTRGRWSPPPGVTTFLRSSRGAGKTDSPELAGACSSAPGVDTPGGVAPAFRGPLRGPGSAPADQAPGECAPGPGTPRSPVPSRPAPPWKRCGTPRLLVSWLVGNRAPAGGTEVSGLPPSPPRVRVRRHRVGARAPGPGQLPAGDPPRRPDQQVAETLGLTGASLFSVNRFRSRRSAAVRPVASREQGLLHLPRAPPSPGGAHVLPGERRNIVKLLFRSNTARCLPCFGAV